MQRAGTVVRKYRPEIRAETDIPGEEQTLAAEDLVSKLDQERCILVVTVYCKDHILAGCKRMHLENGKNGHHDEDRYEE